jgi:hypothetical protein
MLVTLSQAITYNGVNHQTGDVVNVDRQTFQNWVKSGFASVVANQGSDGNNQLETIPFSNLTAIQAAESLLPIPCICQASDTGILYRWNGTTLTPDSSGGSSTFAVRTITAGATDTATTSDNLIVWNKPTGSASAETLPAPTANGGLPFNITIKDGKGDAFVNNITVTPASGTIDGGSNFVIKSNFGSASFVSDGISNYSVD